MTKNDFGQDGSIKDFFWFLNERQAIYERRQAGQAWPWTDDPILRDYYFCNIFREQDKVTAWIREHLREPIIKRAPKAKMPAIMIFNMALARFFNWIPTLEYIGPIGLEYRKRDTGAFSVYAHDWDFLAERLERGLIERQEEGYKIFSDAYLVAGTDLKGKNKITGIMDRLDALAYIVGDIATAIRRDNPPRLQYAWKLLQEVPGIGPFIAYEIVTDLRHTPVLENAADIMTWANPGPGAVRGLQRIHGMHLTAASGSLQRMRELLAIAPKYTKLTLEMRDIEHALCEYDRYLRAKLGQGNVRKYSRKRTN